MSKYVSFSGVLAVAAAARRCRLLARHGPEQGVLARAVRGPRFRVQADGRPPRCGHGGDGLADADACLDALLARAPSGNFGGKLARACVRAPTISSRASRRPRISPRHRGEDGHERDPRRGACRCDR